MRGLRGALIASVFALSLLAVPAAGATEYVPAGTFEGATGGLASQVAVDQASGNVYVAELLGAAPPAPGSLGRFDATGNPLTPSTMGEPDFYAGVTVGDGGDVYTVTTLAILGGSEQVFGFDNAGAPLGAPFPFDFAAGPTTPQLGTSASGNILLGNGGSVIEYSAQTGAVLQTIDCSACPAPSSFAETAGIAVDSAGNIYVAEAGAAAENQRVIKFGPEGDSDPTAPVVFASQSSAGIAINPTNDHVFLSGKVEVEGGGEAFQITEYDPAGNPVSEFGQGEIEASQAGPKLAVNASTGLVYAISNANEGVAIFAPVLPPSATTDPATALSTTAATINGTANPNSSGAITSCEFEWGTNTSYAETPIPCDENPADGFANVAVKGDLEGLSPNTTYHYRLVVESAGGEDSGEDATFTTPVNKPAVSGESASAITQHTASLAGMVNPNGAATSCEFEYGTTAAYGTKVPCTGNPIGSGEAALSVSIPALSGLAANTTYHYRIDATNSGGTTNGTDHTFTTLADTCQTNSALCPPPPPVPTPPTTTPPVTTPPAKKPLKCKKGFKKKKVKGKQKCVKVKKKGKKH